jgi:hypothetical protein
MHGCNCLRQHIFKLVYIVSRGGQCVQKNKDIGANNHYFIGGITFNFHIVSTCYHYVNFYFGLIEKGVALLINPNYL